MFGLEPKRLPGLCVSIFLTFPRCPRLGIPGAGPHHPLETTCQVPPQQPTKQNTEDQGQTNTELCARKQPRLTGWRRVSSFPEVPEAQVIILALGLPTPPSPLPALVSLPHRPGRPERSRTRRWAGAEGEGRQNRLERQEKPLCSMPHPQNGSPVASLLGMGVRDGRCHGYQGERCFIAGQLGGATERVAAAPVCSTPGCLDISGPLRQPSPALRVFLMNVAPSIHETFFSSTSACCWPTAAPS